MGDDRLVYSTDVKENQRCKKCKELIAECRCSAAAALPDKLSAKLRLEKTGRGGKTVTVVAGLPPSKAFLSELAKELKRSCGSGGTYRIEGAEGRIEIQGDRRDALREMLGKKGMSLKG